VTGAIFGFLTIDIALRARDHANATKRTFELSLVFGAASVVLPLVTAAIFNDAPAILLVLSMAGFVGAACGIAYGGCLVIAAKPAWKHLSARTHDGADHAVCAAASWTLLPLGVMGLLLRHDVARPMPEWEAREALGVSLVSAPLDLVGIGITAGVALLSFVRATRRLAARRRWIAAVTAGDEPCWRVREIDPKDDLDRIPRLRQGTKILEHEGEEVRAVYRTPATSDAVAIL
jgi:hypothetical protein